MLYFEKNARQKKLHSELHITMQYQVLPGLYARGVEPADTVKKFMSIIPKQYRPSFLLKDLLYLNSN